jgi:hypothetical protein
MHRTECMQTLISKTLTFRPLWYCIVSLRYGRTSFQKRVGGVASERMMSWLHSYICATVLSEGEIDCKARWILSKVIKKQQQKKNSNRLTWLCQVWDRKLEAWICDVTKHPYFLTEFWSSCFLWGKSGTQHTTFLISFIPCLFLTAEAQVKNTAS